MNTDEMLRLHSLTQISTESLISKILTVCLQQLTKIPVNPRNVYMHVVLLGLEIIIGIDFCPDTYYKFVT